MRRTRLFAILYVAGAVLSALALGGCTASLSETQLPTLPAVGPTAAPTSPPALPSPTMPDPTATSPASPAPTVAATSEGSAGPEDLDPAEAVAAVNGVPIPRSAYEEQVARAQVYFSQQPGFDPASDAGRQALERFRANYLEVMIDQALIAQAADELGLAVSEEAIDAEMDAVRGNDPEGYEAWLEASGLTEGSLRAQVADELRTRAVRDTVTEAIPREQPQLRARHMLFADRESAEEALSRLESGEAFADVAADLSQDEATRASGGDLGDLPRGVMPPAFDEAAWALAPEEPSGIVESEAGLHIILIDEEETVQPVDDAYWPAVQQHAFDEWLAARRAEATIWRAE